MKIHEILSTSQHRPWQMPTGRWKFYQEWNEALFLHWKIPMDILTPLLPKGLAADVIDGHCWVSLVGFTMQRIKPRGLISMPAVSDFHEVNIRAYVVRDGKPGVYFLSVEGEKPFSNFISRVVSGLPYRDAKMERYTQNGQQIFTSANDVGKQHLKVEFEIGQHKLDKLPLDKWLTERYCLYGIVKDRLFKYEIHHAEWPIKEVSLTKLDLQYAVNGFQLTAPPDLVHYSSGVNVVAWGKEWL